ncbi:MAG: FHA domain-containing protein [Bacteroidales bacterium]|nr:FHA domain-containing protein [Bacteroidales bacterium]
MSDTPTIRIKCPNCGAILTVADSPANIGKSVKCPVCQEKYKFTEFKPVQPKNDDSDSTNLGINPSIDVKTELPQSPKVITFGYLLHEGHQKKYTLTSGLNLIGRKTYQTVSVATIPIETSDLGFSRKHLYIEAVKGPDGVIRHYAYNASNKNKTTINGLPLNAEDKVILHDSDVIHSADTTLIFKVSELSFHQASNDSDKTEI